MSAQALLEKIRNGGYDTAFAALYGAQNVEEQRARYSAAVEGFVSTYGDEGDL